MKQEIIQNQRNTFKSSQDNVSGKAVPAPRAANDALSSQSSSRGDSDPYSSIAVPAKNRSAAVPAAVPLASRQPFSEITITHRGYLPHWEIENGFYFITFRLADSLPKAVNEKLEAKRKIKISQLKIKNRKQFSDSEYKRLKILMTRETDDYLDKCHGSCVLAKPEAAEIMAEALKFFQDKKYRLFAWCVMPNHVHVVLKTLPGYTVSRIVGSWKSFTSKEINKLEGTTGRLWQPERYDRLIRDEEEFLRISRYVYENPDKAGLKDWRWRWWCGGNY
jgi:REP element-mobilizing transposase RayT